MSRAPTTSLGEKTPERLFALRSSLEKTQEEVAEAAALTREFVCRLERGKVGAVSRKTLTKLAVALATSPEHLLGPPEEPDLEVKPVAQDPARSYQDTFITGNVLNVGEKFPKRLKAARHRRHLSQIRLAELSGVGVVTVIRLENAQVLPSKNSFYRLAEALEVDEQWLYGYSDEPKLVELVKGTSFYGQ